MYYIYSRRSGKVVHKTTSAQELKLFPSDQYEVVIY